MKELLTDALLREFLLGRVDEKERERIEGLFLTDAKARERVLAAEQDLIEDYLENSLTAAEKSLFLARYGRTAAQQRQLRINKSIKNRALRETASTQTVSVKFSAWSRLSEPFRLKSPLIPIAITALIAIIVVAVWFSSQREQQNRRLAIEQELAQLNSPSSLREVPPQITSLDLSSVAVRSVEQETELKKTADTRLVELRLLWIQKERYATYQAEVRRVGDDESFTIRNLQAEGDGEPVIRVRLQAYLLHRGHYQIQLTGIASDGSMSQPEKYQFAVNGHG